MTHGEINLFPALYSIPDSQSLHENQLGDRLVESELPCKSSRMVKFERGVGLFSLCAEADRENGWGDAKPEEVPG